MNSKTCCRQYADIKYPPYRVVQWIVRQVTNTRLRHLLRRMRRYNYQRGAEIYVPCAHQVLGTYYQTVLAASIVINDHVPCLTSARAR